MSKRNKRKQTSQKQQTPKITKPQHNDALREAMHDPATKDLVIKFVGAVQRAKEEALGLPPGSEDLTEAAQLLASSPQLVSVLNAVQQRQSLRGEVAQYAAPTGSYPQAEAINGGKWATDINEPIGVTNSNILRRWADENEWVRGALRIRRREIEAMHPVVLPLDPKKKYDKKLQAQIQMSLDQPNEYRDSWRSLIGPVIEDVYTLDRGALLKNQTVKRQPVGLYYENGATIKIYPAWSGNPKEPRYLYVSPDGKTKKALRNDECILFMQDAATHRYGLSPIQALQNTIIADLTATKAAADLMSMQPPPNAIQIPKASEGMISKVVANYDQKIAGRKKMFFFGGPEAAHLFPIVYSASDQQFLEYQVYLARKVAILFLMSPQKLGVLQDVNRANGEVQEDIDEDRGLVPTALMIEEQLNREYLADYAPQLPGDRADLEALNLKIVFPEISEAARKRHAKEMIAMAREALPNGLSILTPNMILDMMGEEPLDDGGDTFYAFIPTSGPVKWLSYEEDASEMIQNQPKPEPVQKPAEEDNTGNPSEDDTDGSQAPVNSDDSGNGDQDNPGATEQKRWKKRKASYFDARMPGQAWKPTVYTKKLEEIPEKHKKHGKAPDVNNAEAILKEHVAKMFDSAAKRGKQGLKEIEE